MLLLLVAALLQQALAAQIFDKNTVPSNLTAKCRNAFLRDIQCSPVVANLRGDTYYEQKTLERTCKPACSAALSAYNSAIASACGKETWIGYDDSPMPVKVISDLVKFNYDLVCLTDSGRFCNIVAAGNAAANDPQGRYRKLS